ncbi:hypothetical protein NFJ02_05g120970 [Pycnococcus provasolii]
MADDSSAARQQQPPPANANAGGGGAPSTSYVPMIGLLLAVGLILGSDISSLFHIGHSHGHVEKSTATVAPDAAAAASSSSSSSSSSLAPFDAMSAGGRVHVSFCTS